MVWRRGRECDWLRLVLGVSRICFHACSPSQADSQTEWPGCYQEFHFLSSEPQDWMKLGRHSPLQSLDLQSPLLCRKSPPLPVSKCSVLKSPSGLWEALLNLHRLLITAPFPRALGYFYSLQASSHSSGAGQGGVHLALLLTQDKRAWGPGRFTLAARGFQNSKLFFITATWYEGRCSRCTQISHRRLGCVVEGEDSLKFALMSRKKKGRSHSGHFPLAGSRSRLLKANLVLGQGGSAVTQQPGHPRRAPCLFVFPCRKIRLWMWISAEWF